jgi:tyrosine-specific transport protein
LKGNLSIEENVTAKFIRQVISGTLLISGTAIGAGMLGIPSVTGKAGFFPGVVISILVWLFMYATGLLLLEATLWSHKGASFISLSKRFIGNHGKILCGGTFVFLYYCLMIAYFAEGAPLLSGVIDSTFGINLQGWPIYAFFALFFGIVVGVGLHFVDRVNYILMIGLFTTYALFLYVGSSYVSYERLTVRSWSHIHYAAPILFAAFGYHNIIPSLTSHFKGDGKVMRYSIFFGTAIPLVVYILWQWLIIGSIPREIVVESALKGESVVRAMQHLTGYFWVQQTGKAFALFAIVTSLLGVSFSVVDFLGDGLNMQRKGIQRLILCLLTFVPPFIFTSLNPGIFIQALAVAGGFGEAFINGILPCWLVWAGRYKFKMKSEFSLFGGKSLLTVLLLSALYVMILTLVMLVYGSNY